MELIKKSEHHAEAHHNGKCFGYLTHDKTKYFFYLNNNNKPYTALKIHKAKLHGWIESIIKGVVYEYYSEIVAERRGFKIKA